MDKQDDEVRRVMWWHQLRPCRTCKHCNANRLSVFSTLASKSAFLLAHRSTGQVIPIRHMLSVSMHILEKSCLGLCVVMVVVEVETCPVQAYVNQLHVHVELDYAQMRLVLKGKRFGRFTWWMDCLPEEPLGEEFTVVDLSQTTATSCCSTRAFSKGCLIYMQNSLATW